MQHISKTDRRQNKLSEGSHLHDNTVICTTILHCLHYNTVSSARQHCHLHNNTALSAQTLHYLHKDTASSGPGHCVVCTRTFLSSLTDSCITSQSKQANYYMGIPLSVIVDIHWCNLWSQAEHDKVELLLLRLKCYRTSRQRFKTGIKAN